MSGRLSNLVRVLNLPRWTSSAPAAAEVPLVLEWWQRSQRPQDFASLLPGHVHEHDHQPDEMGQEQGEEEDEGEKEEGGKDNGGHLQGIGACARGLK